MTMDRRTFLSGAATAGGLLLLGGGFWGRQAYARSQFTQELVHAANPILTTKAHKELLDLPGRAREEMRRYIHGVCLNVHGFVDEVCSPDFAARLASRTTQQQQHELLLVVFMREVVTEAQVLNRVQVIAEDISRDLDRNWAACCEELAQKWELSVKEYRVKVTADELGDRMTPLVQRGIRQALEQAHTAVQKPALSDLPDEIGKSAMLLLPVTLQAPWAGWPLFVVQVLKPVFAYLLDQVKDRAHNLQFSVTDKLSQLGNRCGSEFENEVRLRIGDLHKWQDGAVESAARQQAEQLIRWL
jgi:hypothetical protein